MHELAIAQCKHAHLVCKHRLGVDDLTIQAILRHSNVAVTQNCYIKTASEQTQAAMRKLETALSDTFVTPKAAVRTIKRAM